MGAHRLVVEPTVFLCEPDQFFANPISPGVQRFFRDSGESGDRCVAELLNEKQVREFLIFRAEHGEECVKSLMQLPLLQLRFDIGVGVGERIKELLLSFVVIAQGGCRGAPRGSVMAACAIDGEIGGDDAQPAAEGSVALKVAQTARVIDHEAEEE